MAYTQEEKDVLNRDIIKYSEYLEVIEGRNFTMEERKEYDEEGGSHYVDNEAPGFHKIQKRAMALFRKKVGQVHLLPRNRVDYLDLKEDFGIEPVTNIYHTEPYNYKENFRDALAYQMWFMKENDIIMDNGGLNSTTNFTIGSYSQGGQNPIDYRKIFNDLYPAAYDRLEEMGGMYSCLNHHMKTEIFYKGNR